MFEVSVYAVRVVIQSFQNPSAVVVNPHAQVQVVSLPQRAERKGKLPAEWKRHIQSGFPDFQLPFAVQVLGGEILEVKPTAAKIHLQTVDLEAAAFGFLRPQHQANFHPVQIQSGPYPLFEAHLQIGDRTSEAGFVMPEAKLTEVKFRANSQAETAVVVVSATRSQTQPVARKTVIVRRVAELAGQVRGVPVQTARGNPRLTRLGGLFCLSGKSGSRKQSQRQNKKEHCQTTVFH